VLGLAQEHLGLLHQNLTVTFSHFNTEQHGWIQNHFSANAEMPM